MKKLLLILPVIILMFASAAQEKKNRLSKEFKNADNSFKHLYSPDSLLTGRAGERVNVILDSNSSIQFMDFEDYWSCVDSTVEYHFKEKQPLYKIFIGHESISEILDDKKIELLLEYKQECYNDSTLINFDDAWIIQSTDSLELINKLQNYSNFDTAYIKKNNYGYYQLFVNKYFIRHKTPTFEDFLNWIEERRKK